jgi:hypothetical protein
MLASVHQKRTMSLFAFINITVDKESLFAEISMIAMLERPAERSRFCCVMKIVAASIVVGGRENGRFSQCFLYVGWTSRDPF